MCACSMLVTMKRVGSRDGHGRQFFSPCLSVFFLLVESAPPFPWIFSMQIPYVRHTEIKNSKFRETPVENPCVLKTKKCGIRDKTIVRL